MNRFAGLVDCRTNFFFRRTWTVFIFFFRLYIFEDRTNLRGSLSTSEHFFPPGVLELFWFMLVYIFKECTNLRESLSTGWTTSHWIVHTIPVTRVIASTRQHTPLLSNFNHYPKNENQQIKSCYRKASSIIIIRKSGTTSYIVSIMRSDISMRPGATFAFDAFV